MADPIVCATFLSNDFAQYHKSVASSTLVYITNAPEVHLLEEIEMSKELETPVKRPLVNIQLKHADLLI